MSDFKQTYSKNNTTINVKNSFIEDNEHELVVINWFRDKFNIPKDIKIDLFLSNNIEDAKEVGVKLGMKEKAIFSDICVKQYNRIDIHMTDNLDDDYVLPVLLCELNLIKFQLDGDLVYVDKNKYIYKGVEFDTRKIGKKELPVWIQDAKDKTEEIIDEFMEFYNEWADMREEKEKKISAFFDDLNKKTEKHGIVIVPLSKLEKLIS